MRRPIQVRVRGRQLASLKQFFRGGAPSARSLLRAQAVLLAHEGYSRAEIVRITRQSDDTIRRWIRRFNRLGCRGLSERSRSGRSTLIGRRIERFLRSAVMKSPRQFGIHRPTWTTSILAKLVRHRYHIQADPETIRLHLQRIDAVCRRPTWSVKHRAKRQPGYAQKKPPLLAY
jgi:transposase